MQKNYYWKWNPIHQIKIACNVNINHIFRCFNFPATVTIIFDVSLCCTVVCSKVQKGVHNFFWNARTDFFANFLQFVVPWKDDLENSLKKEMLKYICDFFFITFDLQKIFQHMRFSELHYIHYYSIFDLLLCPSYL